MSLLRILVLPGLAILAITASVRAEDYPDPDQLYRVSGIGGGQTLALRQQPGPEGEVVAELPADHDEVVLSGVAVDAAGTTWHEVVHAGERGWAEADRLQGQGGAADNYPLLCTGTEPFWSLSVRAELARFSTPDLEEVAWAARVWLPARGLTGRFAVSLRGPESTGYLAVMRTREYCTDGMSDLRYPFEALLITPAQAVRAGCCRRDG